MTNKTIHKQQQQQLGDLFKSNAVLGPPFLYGFVSTFVSYSPGF